MPISSWTKTYQINPQQYAPKNIKKLKRLLQTKKSFINFGNGRSYGDNCLNKKAIIRMDNFNKIIKFDKINGIIEAQSGIILSDIVNAIVPYKWFLPTTPGTKFVTLGGMVANNIHGKNLNKNFFYDYITKIVIITAQGKILECTKKKNLNLFNLTIGGMGLSGTIISVEFKLKKVLGTQLEVRDLFYKNLNFLKDIEKYSKNKKWNFLYIWIDSYRSKDRVKSIVSLARNSNCDMKNYKKNETKFNLFQKTVFKICNNFFFYRIITSAYYFIRKCKKKKYVHILDYFYPIDKVSNYNELHHKKGLVQFHFFIKQKYILNFFNDFFIFCEKNYVYSTLIVVKIINQKSHNLCISGKGLTLSLDFNNNKKIEEIKNFFVNISKKYKSEFNLSKDLSLNKNFFYKNEKYKIFKKNIIKYNKNYKYNSIFSNRIGLTYDK